MTRLGACRNKEEDRPPRRVARRLLRGGLGAAVLGVIGFASLAQTPQAPPAIEQQPGTTSTTPLVDQFIRDSATGVILPDEPLNTDLKLAARLTRAWRTGETYRMLLETDVSVSIGSYGFKARNAAVFATRVQRPGPTTWQIEIYLEDVSQLGGYGPIRMEGRRLLVTAMIQGRVLLDTDRLVDEPAHTQPLMVEALTRVDGYYRNLRLNKVPLGDVEPTHGEDVLAYRAQRQAAVRGTAEQPAIEIPPSPPVVEGEPTPPPPAEAPMPRPTRPPVVVTPPQPAEPVQTEEERRAQLVRLVNFHADRVIFQDGEEEGYVMLVGHVQVMHHDPVTKLSTSLTADRAVIFTEPGLVAGQQQLTGDVVRGVYLEDNVIATTGDYTMRGPRVFYDLTTNRAIVLEAVFYTWDMKRQVPLYLRAQRLMQVARNQWKAGKATLSTSEFAEPHFAIGVDKLTVNRDEEEGEDVYRYRASGGTLRVADVPVFYWPGMAGRISDSPIRRADLNIDDDDGVVVKTEWDLFALLGKQGPAGVDATLIADAYTQRGAAVGLDLNYDVPKAFGRLASYLMYDTGEDEPGGRNEVDPEDELRAIIHLQHRHYLPNDWELSLELSYISDRTFLEEFFPGSAYEDKTWESSVYLKKQVDDWAFTFLAKYDLIDFIPQLTTLQTPGYTVDKFPEIAYYRVGTPLFGDRVTWFSENRASILRLNVPQHTPGDLGFNAAESVALFGIAATTRFDSPAASPLVAADLDDDEVYRFDTRQELNLPMKVGIVDVVPYVVGRFTVYDEDFSAFSGEDEDTRLWAQAGVKLHTSFSRTYEQVESRLLDLHRLRHIIEPSVHLSYAWTNIDQDDLPVYDYDVESLAEGAVARFGLRNTLQTQRGGEGHWRSVDWLRIDTDFIMADEKTSRESPIARFFDYRPEYSIAGDHFWTEVAWQITDALATIANMTYSFDSDHVERWAAGMTYDHTPRLTSFAQLRRIDALDSLILRYGFDYLLSAKYHVSVSHSLDLDRGEDQDFSVVVTRRLPRMLLMVAVSYDWVEDNTSVGVSLTPEGAPGHGEPQNNPFLMAP